MTEYDSPWKEALDQYFRYFMALCFPKIHALIDWSVEPKMLDKELQQISAQSESGGRTVDKLVEVRLHDGDIEWILIHLEIQNQWTSSFAERMFVYFYRIRDKYNRRVVSLAVLGDNNPNWRPDRYRQSTLDCSVEFTYPLLKLLDFSPDLAWLERSENPFSTVILAHLVTLQTQDSPRDRCQWKLRLLRPLYARGLSADEVRQLFRVIDWMMELPADFNLEFRSALMKIEEENQMPYITSIERHGREEGREEGVIAGKIQLLQKIVGERVSTIDELLRHPLTHLTVEFERLQKAANLQDDD